MLRHGWRFHLQALMPSILCPLLSVSEDVTQSGRCSKRAPVPSWLAQPAVVALVMVYSTAAWVVARDPPGEHCLDVLCQLRVGLVRRHLHLIVVVVRT